MPMSLWVQCCRSQSQRNSPDFAAFWKRKNCHCASLTLPSSSLLATHGIVTCAANRLSKFRAGRCAACPQGSSQRQRPIWTPGIPVPCSGLGTNRLITRTWRMILLSFSMILRPIPSCLLRSLLGSRNVFPARASSCAMGWVRQMSTILHCFSGSSATITFHSPAPQPPTPEEDRSPWYLPAPISFVPPSRSSQTASALRECRLPIHRRGYRICATSDQPR